MKYQELIDRVKKEYDLDSKSIEYILEYYFNIKGELEYASIDNEVFNILINKVKRLKAGEPIQYVVGNVDFYGNKFTVDKRVLIPRFETEELVHYTKEYINKYFKENISLIDVGTGSGAIGLTLKKEIPSLNVTLVDISTEALEMSSINAKNLGLKVNIYKSDMLKETIKRKEKYDVLISNPPYLTKIEEIMDIVKKNEPSIALYGGNDGLKYYRLLFRDAKLILKDKALIALEIGATQADDIIKLANKYFEGCPYEIKKDLEGRDRMFFLFYNLGD
ncbi:MAG: peptide chain release factor N(5)-glutamine methyltransferase [Bacilli bacterium]|nr:peptide chain release factor N(5)-glutamine methyltransferase [Bacilli bacterium]MDD4411347.1 peptide chain release factor N(5)-glutamine methyltransferase [Bacilli bacterium]